jgi:hypothetical protein
VKRNAAHYRRMLETNTGSSVGLSLAAAAVYAAAYGSVGADERRSDAYRAIYHRLGQVVGRERNSPSIVNHA